MIYNLIYNLMKRVQKYNHKSEKIEVHAVSYHKEQMSGTSKGRRQSWCPKVYSDFVSQIFCLEELFSRKC